MVELSVTKTTLGLIVALGLTGVLPVKSELSEEVVVESELFVMNLAILAVALSNTRTSVRSCVLSTAHSLGHATKLDVSSRELVK